MGSPLNRRWLTDTIVTVRAPPFSSQNPLLAAAWENLRVTRDYSLGGVRERRSPTHWAASFRSAGGVTGNAAAFSTADAAVRPLTAKALLNAPARQSSPWRKRDALTSARRPRDGELVAYGPSTTLRACEHGAPEWTRIPEIVCGRDRQAVGTLGQRIDG